jgi:hypothetical protein
MWDSRPRLSSARRAEGRLYNSEETAQFILSRRLCTMNSSPALTATKTVIRWLRWAAVLVLVYYSWGGLIYSALGRKAWALQPAALAAFLQYVGMLHYHTLREAGFIVAGAMIAPRFRLATAIILAAARIPLLLWAHVLSRVSLVDLVLLQGGENYIYLILETLGAVLGVVYIIWSEKAKRSVTSAPPSHVSFLEPPAGSAGAKAAVTAAKTVIRWLRWVAVLALIYYALDDLVYSALGPESSAHRPAALAVVQEWLGLFFYHTLSQAGFVVAGAIIAPRARLATAIVLAAALVPFSFWAHVLATGGPWWFWTISYTHFTLEALGCVLGLVSIFWSEKAKGSVASIPPSQLSLSETPPRSAGKP